MIRRNELRSSQWNLAECAAYLYPHQLLSMILMPQDQEEEADHKKDATTRMYVCAERCRSLNGKKEDVTYMKIH